jgi:hypothetical protein
MLVDGLPKMSATPSAPKIAAAASETGVFPSSVLFAKTYLAAFESAAVVSFV